MSTVRRGRRTVATFRGGVMLGASFMSFSVAYIAGWPELLILATFCGVLPLLALLAVSIRRPRFVVERASSPSVLRAGGASSTRIRLRSAARVHRASVRWSDQLPWGTDRIGWRELAPINPGAHVIVQYGFVPPRRGIVELGPLVVELRDPFGLARAEQEVGPTHRIVVAPEAFDLGQGLSELASDSGSARLFQHRALAGDHDIMTRDYRPGDALNRVHWKSSAHHGELMVREDDKRSHAEAVIIVNTRRTNWRDVSRSSSRELVESECFEWALSFTSSLRDYLVRNGLRVRVVESAVPQFSDAGNAQDFIESLARVRLSYQDGPALSVVEPGASGTGSLFTVLDAPDAETVEALSNQRSGFGFAAAFMLGPVDTPLDEHLVRAGWLVCRVAPGESVLRAWQRMALVSSDAPGQSVAAGERNG